MQTTTARARARVRLARRRADAYNVCLGTAAGCCLLAAMAVLVARPQWGTPILRVPVGAYLLGGLSGLVALVGSPATARRLGSRRPLRVVLCAAWRLSCALLLGGLGHALVGLAAGLQDPGSAASSGYIAALICGAGEKPINDALLGWLGLLASPDVDPRAL